MTTPPRPIGSSRLRIKDKVYTQEGDLCTVVDYYEDSPLDPYASPRHTSSAPRQMILKRHRDNARIFRLESTLSRIPPKGTGIFRPTGTGSTGPS